MFLDFIETVEYDKAQGIQVNGVAEHFVTTEDGYILRVFQMKPLPKCEGKSKGPMIWWHGLFLSANTCILLGEGCQCYEYLQACYDVYVPNTRGNQYSRNHTTLDPDKDSKFWDFGIEEMASYDVPAVLDYVLQVTNSSQTAWVGHAQGITILVVACALKPEYNAKISMAFGQSPTFWLGNATSPLLVVAAISTPGLTVIDRFGENGELFPHRGLLSNVAIFLCTHTTLSYPLCLSFLYFLVGYNGVEISENAIKDSLGKEPSGISTNLFAYYGYVKVNGFKDTNGNDWPLDNVTLKLRLISSPNDNIGDLKDAQIFLQHIPNSPYEVCVLRDPLFGHLDHFAGNHSALYDSNWVIKYLDEGSSGGCVGTTVVAPDTTLVS